MNTTMKAMGLDLEEFRQVNVQRAIEGFRCYDNQPITYWTTALAGEVGELCNMIKKIQRVEKGGIDGGSSYSAKDITPDMLKEEIGGIAIYLDLLASLLGISLEEAIVDTFNSKSEKMGFLQYVRLKKPDEQVGDRKDNISFP
jgi:NTP pyrophosphatase (non-canonical NTP hydrolase)